jgi:glycosyltransferase involved in cell wall biosynthesis
MNNKFCNERVTAIIITHNRLERLKRAINSVLTQTYTNIELIIVNDGSEDGTIEYLDELSLEYTAITIIHHRIAKGACAARNTGLKAATGLYVAGLDDDDEWLPDRIATLKNAYSHNYSFTYASDRIISDNKQVSLIRRGTTDLNSILSENRIGNQIFTETYKLCDIGGFDVSMPAAQDWDVWIRLILKYGPAYACSDVLQNIYQEGDDRITSSPKKYLGYRRLFNKYRHIMSKSNRASQMSQLYIAKNKRMSFKVLMVMSKNSVGLKGLLKAAMPKQFYFVKRLSNR